MASHLSDIGFLARDEGEFRALVVRAAEEGSRITCSRGFYVRWSPGEGIELWVQGDNDNVIVGCNPHFSGSAWMRVGVTELIEIPDHALEGSLSCWADPASDDPESGMYPFVLDLPDFALVRARLAPGTVVAVQIAAFAHELSCFRDDADFAGEQGGEFKWAPESFVPSGLFASSADSSEPPPAEAIFAGHVVETRMVRNPVTDVQFHHLLVRTLGGLVDVVADPEIVTGTPVVNGVLRGSFWLSGRVG